MALILVVMGVSGAGKTTLGERLAAAFGWPFLEGDSMHPANNVAKMRAGVPLDDVDRGPWLDRLGEQIETWLGADQSAVLSCSALRRRYRETLSRGGAPVRFVYLRAERETLTRRLHDRVGHYMPASLLGSQLATLEEPDETENAIVITADRSLDEAVALVRTAVRQAGPAM